MSNNSNKSPRILLIGLVSLLWLVASLVGYYYTHKPFAIEFVAAALTGLWRLLVAAGIISLSGGVGACLLSKRTSFPALTGLAIQAALGSGIIGLAVLFLGVTIGFQPLYFSIFGLFLLILLRRYILVWLSQWTQFSLLFNNGFALLLSLAIGMALFWTLATALAPPLYFDALTYHLALPRSYLLNGDMAYDPHNIFWGMPQQTEMLFTFAMALAGTEAATTLGWGFGVLTLVGLLGYINEKINLTAGWVAVVCLLGGGSLVTSLSSGYTEWLVMLYGLGMIAAIDTWRNTSKRGYLILAAALAGFALGTKYTAGQLILIGLVIVAGDGMRQRDRRVFAHLLLFGLAATLVSLPWWIKNWLATSNPFYPLLWPAGAMTSARLAYYTGGPWGSWLDMLILPWQATVWGLEGREGFSWSIGPLLLGFGALSWVGWQARGAEQKRLLSTTAITTLTGFLLWAVASRWNGLLIQTRLYTAFFPAWAILGGFGFEAISNLRAMGVRFGHIAAAVILLVFSFNLIEIGTGVINRAPFAILAGSAPPASYRTRNLGSYEKAMTALQALPPNASVLMLWETRSLACLPICDPDEVIDRWYDNSLEYASAEEALAAWRAQGYTHLLLYVTGKNFVQEYDSRISPENWAKLEALLESLPPPEIVGEGYELYKLR